MTKSNSVPNSLSAAIGGVLFNVSNFPARVQSLLLGQDMTQLREKLEQAVLTSYPEIESSLKLEKLIKMFNKAVTKIVDYEFKLEEYEDELKELREFKNAINEALGNDVSMYKDRIEELVSDWEKVERD